MNENRIKWKSINYVVDEPTGIFFKKFLLLKNFCAFLNLIIIIFIKDNKNYKARISNSSDHFQN